LKESVMREGHTEEPAEGSREVIDRELERRRERERNKVDHLPGVKVSGQPQGGAVDRAEREQRIRTRAYRMWEENGRPEKSAERFWLQAEREEDREQADSAEA
jgi:hypothetical protein